MKLAAALRLVEARHAVPNGIEAMAVEEIATHAYKFSSANDIAVQLRRTPTCR